MYIQAADHEEKRRSLLGQSPVLKNYFYGHRLQEQVLVGLVVLFYAEVEPQFGWLVHKKNVLVCCGLDVCYNGVSGR